MINDLGKNKFTIRLTLVKYARTHGIRAAASHYECSRNTVRTWLRRYEKKGLPGLRDHSQAPKTCPHKTSPHQEKKIIAARQQAPCFGPQRLKDYNNLKASTGAIARILRQKGLAQKRRRKHKRKNDLRHIKMQYKAFERTQADTKPLRDIPFYWPQMKSLDLPQHQYTHIDVKSGALFLDYANELSTTYATLGSERIIAHLGRFGVKLDEVVLTSDNGSEYGGGERRERQIGYHASVQATGARHRFLPPRTPNAHGNVESSHAKIEEELFDLEGFRSRGDFFEKVTTYQNWWNFARLNYSKGRRTPAQILEEEGVDPRTLLLTPADLDYMFRHAGDHGRVG